MNYQDNQWLCRLQSVDTNWQSVELIPIDNQMNWYQLTISRIDTNWLSNELIPIDYQMNWYQLTIKWTDTNWQLMIRGWTWFFNCYLDYTFSKICTDRSYCKKVCCIIKQIPVNDGVVDSCRSLLNDFNEQNKELLKLLLRAF